MTMLARKIGKNIIPVVEKFTELEADRPSRRGAATSGRPSACASSWPPRGAGRWQSSAGYRSKFGLTLTEVLEAVEYLKQRDMADCLQLVHFHLGSQITNIRSIKNALTEAARVYVELHRVGAGVKYIDVGGGLGIDYDGSQTDFESSVNYTLQEYANDVVFRVKSVCDEAGVPHPTIISESGRAVVAYHSVLVFDVLGVSQLRPLRGAAGGARRRAAADRRPVRHPPRPEEEEPAGELPRRRAGGGRGAQPVQPRLLHARACAPWPSGCSGRCAASC